MNYSLNMRTATTLTFLLSACPLLASGMGEGIDDLTQGATSVPVFVLPEQNTDTDDLSLRFANDVKTISMLYDLQKYNDIIALYESDKLMKNVQYFDFHFCIAGAYLGLSETSEDPIEKASLLTKGRDLMEMYETGGNHELERLRFLNIACRDLYDVEMGYAYAQRIINLAGENVTPRDMRDVFLAAVNVGQHDQAYVYWQDILARFIKSPEFDGNVATLGAHCSYYTRHFDDTIRTACHAMRLNLTNELIADNSRLVILSFIEKGMPGKAAEILELNFNVRGKDAGPVNANNFVYMITLFADAGNHKKATDHLKSLQEHPHMTPRLYKIALGAVKTCIKMAKGPLQKIYKKQQAALFKTAQAAFPDDFKNASVPSIDIGRHIRGELLDTYRAEAERIVSDVASIKEKELASLKAPIFAAYKTILSCTPDNVVVPSVSSSSSSSSSSSASSSVHGSGVIIAQNAIGQMRLEKSRLMRASQTHHLQARRAALQRQMRESTPVSIQETPAKNYRGDILREHGLPLSAPKPSDANVEWESPAASSVPVVEEAAYEHAPLSALSLLSSSTYETFSNIMEERHHSVTNKHIKALIEALFASGYFEKGSYDKKAGKGSHAKVKLWRTGTLDTQRPKPVTLPKHEAAKDYTMDQLKALFEANGLTL